MKTKNPVKSLAVPLRRLRDASYNAQKGAIDTADIGLPKKEGKERVKLAKEALAGLREHWGAALRSASTKEAT